MSESMSPYQSPQTEMQPESIHPANVSAVPKVFGILHLVFGGIGIVWSLISLGASLFRDKVEEMQFSTYPEEVREQMKEAMQPVYDTQSWDVIAMVGTLILAILLIVSGLKLIKYRRQGRKISNIYSGLSVAHKLFYIGIVIFVKAPAMKQVGESLEKMSGQANANMGAILGPIAIGSGILYAVVLVVYPILCFFMLGKKQSVDSLH